MSGSTPREAAREYASPYVAGVALGLVLLSAYVIAGRGLGASGAFASAASAVADVSMSRATRGNEFFAFHRDAGGLLRDWLVIEVIGVLLGGFASALLARRLRLTVEQGPRARTRSRLAFAASGGAVMGTGAAIARGCTSGQGLTGGALLSVGSWLFIAGAFASAYLVAWLLRRQWT